MAISDLKPVPADAEIYKSGELICVIQGDSRPIDDWTEMLGADAGATIAWHRAPDGFAHVLHLGDAASLERVRAAIRRLEAALDGVIMGRAFA